MDRNVTAALVLAAALAAGVSAEAADVNQTAVLPGKVAGVAPVSQPVKEGDVLVTVDSLVGPVPAARANADGVVKKILVKQGDNVAKQQVVAIIETK